MVAKVLKRIGGAKSAERTRARGYVRGAWRLFRRDLLLLVWRLLADGFQTVVALTAGGLVALLVVGRLMAAVGTGSSLVAMADQFVGDLIAPAFIVPAAWFVAAAALWVLTVDAVVTAGIWGTLAAGVRGEPIRVGRSFFKHATSRFPAVLGLRITGLAVQTSVAMLAISVVVACALAMGLSSPLRDANPWAQGLVWAAPLTLLFVLSGLARLGVEAAAAPLMVDGQPLGRAVLGGLGFMLRHFVDLYRLLAVVLGLFLVPLTVYWAIALFQNITLVVPELSGAALLMQLVGDVILLVAGALVGILFYGALFLFYADATGRPLPPALMADEPPAEPPRRPSARRAAQPARDEASPPAASQRAAASRRQPSLEELLPASPEHVFALDEVLETDEDADHAAPAPADADDPSEPDDEPRE